MPWTVGEVLTPRALLQALGAHPEIVNSPVATKRVVTEADEEYVGNEEFVGPPPPGNFFREALSRWLDSHEPHTAVFHAGSGKLNPLPCFAVALVRPGLVAGFIGGIVHT